MEQVGLDIGVCDRTTVVGMEAPADATVDLPGAESTACHRFREKRFKPAITR